MKRSGPLRRNTPLRSSTPLRRQSKKQAAKVRDWMKIKRAKIERQMEMVGYTFCEVCKKTTPEYLLQLDHIHPTGTGGAWVEENSQLICSGPGSCHSDKHGEPEWTPANPNEPGTHGI